MQAESTCPYGGHVADRIDHDWSRLTGCFEMIHLDN